MTIISDFYTAISTAAGGRVYPGTLPQQATYPAVVYNRIGGTNTSSLVGDVDLDNAAMQVDVFAETSASSEALAESVRALINAASTFESLTTSKRGPGYDTAEIPPLYRYSYDFSIWHSG